MSGINLIAALTFVLLASLGWSVHARSLGSNCPPLCFCDFTLGTLTIQCVGPQSNGYFNMPDIAFDIDLETTSSIIVRRSYLSTYPNYVCQYAQNLTSLDLSSNIIAERINSTGFNCLQNLLYLNMSHNLIRAINPDAFNRLNMLAVLDLNSNLLDWLPPTLFYNKLPRLKYLYLQNNTLVSLDPWFFFFKSIVTLDLSFNKISTFTNFIGWSPDLYNDSRVLQNANLIDLRYNIITSFDDYVLQLYYICNYDQLSVFLKFLYKVRIDANPIECTCHSYHLLKFFQILISNNSLSLSNNLFMTTCTSPSKYAGKSVFNFEQTDYCFGLAALETITNCQSFTLYTTGVTSAASPQDQQLVNTNDSAYNVPNELTGAQVAGIVIGVIAFILLLLFTIYCLFRIEVNSLLFSWMPCMYSWCPCKRNDETSKYYDVFICHSKDSNDWLEEKLIPFLRIRKAVNKFFLQYSQKNSTGECISPYLKNIMDNSACILLILSESFIINEWQNRELRAYIKNLVTNNEARLICVQLHDISDEEVDDYVRNCLQIPVFPSLEVEELLFWHKLAYYLYTNRRGKDVVTPNLRSTQSLSRHHDSQSSFRDNLPPLSMSIRPKNPRGLPLVSAKTADLKLPSINKNADLEFRQSALVSAPLVHVQSSDDAKSLNSYRAPGPFSLCITCTKVSSPVSIRRLKKPSRSPKLLKRLDSKSRKKQEDFLRLSQSRLSDDFKVKKEGPITRMIRKLLAKKFRQKRPDPPQVFETSYNMNLSSGGEPGSSRSSIKKKPKTSSLAKKKSSKKTKKPKRRVSIKENKTDFDYLNLPRPTKNILSEDS